MKFLTTSTLLCYPDKMNPVVEVREDGEQGIKLQETMELLVAAGYFRARIKGLHPFDKASDLVVGGMVWCLEFCNLDIDVDLNFQESLTIGQKISLTEKIVGALPEMKCPHRLDPHQIQGLDFIHIFPVVQWLVKKAIATRTEYGDTNRAFGLMQFERRHELPEDVVAQQTDAQMEKTLAKLSDVYAPRRKYRRRPGAPAVDVPTQIRFTLLEYGKRAGEIFFSQDSAVANSSNKNTSKTGNRQNASTSEQARELGGKKASAVGSNVSQHDDEDAQMEVVDELQMAKLEEMSKNGMSHALDTDENVIDILLHQLEELRLTDEELTSKKALYLDQIEQLKGQKRALKEKKLALDSQNREMDEEVRDMDESELATISSLLEENLALERQISNFRNQCKAEAGVLNAEYRRFVAEIENPPDESSQLSKTLQERLELEREQVRQIRLRLANRNREIAQLQRSIDDHPSQAELSQYQKRFVELYDQVAAKLRETKKYYTLYNSLTDSKKYYEMEVQLLESMHDNFGKALGSDSGKEQFLRQLEQILDSLRQSMTKAERRRVTEKVKRDQLSDKYQELLEKQRVYHKLVKDFQEECAKNEILQAELDSTS